MIRTLFAATLAVLAAAAPSFAGSAPWEKKQPAGMTQEHAEIAAAVNKRIQKIGREAFGWDPLDVLWKFQGGKRAKQPVSNMTATTVQKLFIGNYWIYGNPGKGGGSDWSILYFSNDGVDHFCRRLNGKTHEFVNNRVISKTWHGEASFFHINPGQKVKRNELAWPMIYDSKTGSVAVYAWNKGKRKYLPMQGWVQAEYPAAAQQYCPNLPRKAKVNASQTGSTLAEIAKGAKPIRGIPVAYKQNLMNPLTAEMLYWAYPPVK
ncbi:hypothetical protein [Tropicibacter alexandrii]|uniref:hypothetical protein n=1 Tax=Tropicibacter alexandrii TaxID=2267683 RepID=UPI001008EFFF|nr:hypothetical protein [Tropicibacter alexandrii]